MSAVKDNVVRLYDVKPELALEHLKRSTGLDFDDLPPNLARLVRAPASADIDSEWMTDCDSAPPILTDIVSAPVFPERR